MIMIVFLQVLFHLILGATLSVLYYYPHLQVRKCQNSSLERLRKLPKVRIRAEEGSRKPKEISGLRTAATSHMSCRVLSRNEYCI